MIGNKDMEYGGRTELLGYHCYFLAVIMIVRTVIHMENNQSDLVDMKILQCFTRSLHAIRSCKLPPCLNKVERLPVQAGNSPDLKIGMSKTNQRCGPKLTTTHLGYCHWPSVHRLYGV